MKSTIEYDHDSNSTLDAMGVDREKLQFVVDHLNQLRENKEIHAVSQELAECIKMAINPEELALLAYGLGKQNAGQPPSDVLMDMLKKTFGDLLDEDEDE